MDDVKSGKIAVFYVGPDLLFDLAHIPGSQKMGAISTESGHAALEAAIAKLSPETEIVLYCGCCPIRNCPNIGPGSALLRSLGRKNAYWLDLPTKFITDWADKGYPTEPA